MSSLLIPCSVLEVRAVEADVGPSLWVRLVRAIVSEYRIRRAVREMRALDDQMLRDIGLDRGGAGYAARFGRG